MAEPIPIRNIWLLFLYAADLVRFKDSLSVQVETARNLPELLARLLVRVMQERLRRNLSRGYQNKHSVLTRVRGRIDILGTASGQLLERGRVACHFDVHTMDTPRNRLVRSALDYLAKTVPASEVAHECNTLSQALGRLGVSAQKPSHATLAQDQISRNETADLLMVSLAKMVFNTTIPSQQAGNSHAVAVDVNEHLVRRLFEKAVANALRIQLQPLGWQVQHGRKLRWPITQASDGIATYFPGMQTDIELTHTGQMRRIVVDTKFTKIFSATQYRNEVLRSTYLYQIYAYLRTQETALQVQGMRSEGMLLHPQLGESLDAYVDMQGHRIRFKTIDLTTSAESLEKQLLGIISTMS